MPKAIYDLKPVSRVTASAVGVPGQRTFYIQARDELRLFTLLCEKQQVEALGAGIAEILEQLDKQHPEREPSAPVPDSDLALEEPLEPAFRVGNLVLGYDQEADAVVIIAYEIAEAEDADPETLSAARIWMTRSQARAVSRHAAAVVARGRPICPLCGEPMDAVGHVCPKKNGHKKIELA